MPSLSPLEKALIVWDMAAPEKSGTTDLVLEGAVKLGLELSGMGREASIIRGGNGQVAAFEGGHIVLASTQSETLRLAGKAMSFYMRVCAPSGRWNAPLFARHDPQDPAGLIL